MTTEAQAIDRIATALKDQALLPFVGAGVSCWPGACKYVANLQAGIQEMGDACENVTRAIDIACEVARSRKWLSAGFVLEKDIPGWPPTWFLHLCMLALLSPADRDRYSHSKFSALAQFLRYGDSTRRLMAQLLHKLFHPQYGQLFGAPNQLHGLIVHLPCNHIVTTNFDTGLEVASQRTASPLRPVRDDEALMSAKVSGRRIFKLHGDFCDLLHIDEETAAAAPLNLLSAIIFQEDGFWNFPGQPHQTGSRNLLCNYLTAVLPLSQVVFLGYGFDDPNIHEIFRSVPQWPPERRPLLVLEYEPDEAAVALWNARLVDVVHVPDLESFLKRINDKFYKPLHAQSGGIGGGEIDSLSLALGVQWLFDLIPPEPERTKVIHRLAYDRPMFSVGEAHKLGLKVQTDADFAALLDTPGGLRMVYPQSDSDPAVYALDTELRCFLKKIADGKKP